MNRSSSDFLLLASVLTGRELEVLTYVGEGLTNREIAEKMTVALSTVKWYVRQIYNKLGVENREEAVLRAKEAGILTDLDEQARRHLKLPAQLTSFVGRRREIADVRQLLMTARLVTLTGAGGSGKTRLALQVARESAGQFKDGIYFVSLAAVHDPSLMLNEVVQELGITERANLSLSESIQQHFGSQSVLLILDNFEHIMAAAPELAHLLTLNPHLTILVTSREILRLSGEHEYRVPPLITPELSKLNTLGDLASFESVALFAQRAEAVSTHFSLTDENAAIVAKVCDQLDGLPLAIELAAARIKVFTAQQLLDRLEDRLGLLVGGPRDTPARQRTLRATIDWSFDLLEEGERILFTRLATFSEGASLYAIETVCQPGLKIDVLQGVESLLNKSLLYQQESPDGELRFMMLDTLHEYAADKLAESREEKEMRDHHLAFFLQMAEEAEPRLEGAEQVVWQKRIDAEYDNFRAALEWSQLSAEKAQEGLRLAGSLAVYWHNRSSLSEGRRHLAGALNHPAASRHKAPRAKALSEAGLLAYMQGDYPATRFLLEESLMIFRDLGPDYKRGLADTLITYGDMETELGAYETASSLMHEGLQIMRELGDDKGIARALWQLGACAVRPGNYVEAVQYFEQALPLLRQIGDRSSTAIAISGLSEVAIRQGKYERALKLEEESLFLRREIGEKWGIAVSLGNFAWIAMGQRDLARAKELLKESLTLRCEIGDVGGAAWCLEKLAEIAIGEGLVQTAPESRKQFEIAATLLGAADGLRSPIYSVIDLVDQPHYTRLVADVKTHLATDVFEFRWTIGARFTLQQALGYALEF